MKKYYGKKRQKSRKKQIIEIRTTKNKWKRVELLSIDKGGRITIRLPSGEVLKRTIRRVRWGIHNKHSKVEL